MTTIAQDGPPGARTDRGSSLCLALAYSAFGTAWILWSDGLMFKLTDAVPALASLSLWKGMMFVALSAVILYVGVRHARRGVLAAPAAPAPTPDTWLAIVSALAALAIVGTGISGGMAAASAERDEVVDSLQAVVEMKSAIWTRWLAERQREVDLLRDDTELSRLIVQQGGQEPSDRALAAYLRRLCERYGCIDAQVLFPDASSLPTAGPVAPWPAVGVTDPDLGLEIASRSAGRYDDTGAVLALRFDARPTIADMLRPQEVAVEDARLLLTRRDRAERMVLRVPGVGRGVVAIRSAASATDWPDTASLDGAPARAFDAVDGDGVAVTGVAATPARLGWMLSAHVERAHLFQRAWGEIWWIVVADMAALVCALLCAYGLRQKRELTCARRERAEQDERLRVAGLLDAIANGTPDIIYAKDLQGRYIFANEATCSALGHPRADVIGRNSRSFFSAEDAARVDALNAEVITAGDIRCSEGELTTAAGPRSFLRTIGPLRDAEGRIGGTFGIVHDITERKSHERRQRQWAQAFESTRDGVMITDPRGCVEAVNPAFTEITGYALAEVVGRTPALLQSGRHDAAFYRALWRDLKSRGHWSGEVWNRRRNGEVYPEWLAISAVRDDGGAVANYVGVFTDITRIKEDEARLEHLANYDPLTRLPNRRLMLSRLQQALAQGQRHGRRTALLYIDLDGFKTVNDSLGHPAGDELLTCIAQRLNHRLEAAMLSRDLLAAIAQPVMLSSGRETYVTASIGISLHPDDGAADANELLRDADAAMYRAKAQGRNGFSFYTQELNAQAVSKLDTEAALNRALERGELLLHYQPKVDAADGRIVGAEALLRWHRGGELVPPARFIPLAEASSLILQIGDWAIDEACAQIRRWRERGLPMPSVAVNVAARQFAADNLDRVVHQALKRHGIPADRLELELTESMLVENTERGIALLGRLRAIGVTLSLDDFGTGYSSLAYLRQFPIDALKIDKSFVDQIGTGPDGSAIVDAVIELAHRLHLDVVAEGVETAVQQDHLRRRRCDVLQGYAIGRPMTPDAFEALWRAQVCAADAPLPL